jgi:hypothetical protein
VIGLGEIPRAVRLAGRVERRAGVVEHQHQIAAARESCAVDRIAIVAL